MLSKSDLRKLKKILKKTKAIKKILKIKTKNIKILSASIASLVIISSLFGFLEVSREVEQLLDLSSIFETYLPSQTNYKTQAVVARVVDGDTVVLEDGRTVRYLNIDTPETKKPGTKVQCFGPEASEVNKKLTQGKTFILKSDKQLKDRYDRDLLFLFELGVDTHKIENSVNAQMVKLGMARASIYKPNDTFASTFYRLEKQAKQNNIGIWKKCNKPFED